VEKEYGDAWDDRESEVELAKPVFKKAIFRRTDSQLFTAPWRLCSM
jgi:hypothetical protein